MEIVSGLRDARALVNYEEGSENLLQDGIGDGADNGALAKRLSASH